jgi:undecaprenyl-diphosphatase
MSDGVIIYFAQYLAVFPPLALVVFSLTLPGARRNHLYLLGAAGLLAAYALARLGGMLYFDPRPFVSDGVTPLIRHAATNGMPSEHMLFVATLAMVAWCFDKRFGAALWFMAIMVGVARVLAGVHHPIDIATSSVIAIGAVWAVERVMVQRKWVADPSEQRMTLHS